jgi:hypothetical protein
MGAATLAVIGASITGAEARIPGVGNGIQQTTDAPDLRSVTIDAPDLRRVKFCFDQALVSVPGQTGFFVQSYDSKRFIQSTSAVIATGSENRCVQAIMGSAASISEGTIGSVDSDSVMVAGGAKNLSSSEPLGGSTATPVAGRTTGPDLVGATKDPDDRSIVFSFDESFIGDPTASNFAYVDDKGFPTSGISATRSASNAVRVKFPVETAGGGTVAAAASAFSNAGAVSDAPQSGVSVAGTPLSTPSGTGVVLFSENNSRTRLVAIATDGSRQLRLTYNNAVNARTSPNRIVAVLDDGTSIPASRIEDITSNTLRATFQSPGAPDINADPTALVRVVDIGGAAETDDAEKLGSLAAAVAAGTPKDAPGFTNGPDLLFAAYDAPGSRVFYSFDENLGAATSSLFFVTAPSGSSSSTSASNTTNGGVAAVTFGASANGAIGGGNRQGAAIDPLGNPSPRSAVSYQVEQAPAPIGTTPPTTNNPPPPPPPPPTTKRAKFRTSFSSFKVRSRTKYSGRIRSSGRGCKSGRRIFLKRSGRTIRRGSTRGDGTFTIKRTKSTKGKRGVYVVVSERTTSTTICTARGSKKLKRG